MKFRRYATVTIDGEPVHLECARLSVGRFNTLVALCGERGANPKPVARQVVLDRIKAIDEHVTLTPGSFFLVDDQPRHTGLAGVYASRDDVIGSLYLALMSSQQPTEKERSDLLIAARFSDWLSSSKRVKSQWLETGTSCQTCHELEYCGKRGCDGVDKKRPVWHDKKLVLHVCPVLSFTSEVEATLRLFFWSHTAVIDGMSVRWQQAHFLDPGGLNDQDAWLTGAFSYLRGVQSEIVRDAIETQKQHG